MLAEYRQGRIVDAMAATADGRAMADAALLLAYRPRQEHPRRATPAADPPYGRRDPVQTRGSLGVLVHAAWKSGVVRSMGAQRSRLAPRRAPGAATIPNRKTRFGPAENL